MAGNNWRHILDRRIIVSAGGTSLCNRNAGRNALNKDSIVTGNLSVGPSFFTPTDRRLGCAS